MVWFRASPADDAAVLRALGAARTTLADLTKCRIGSRRQEEKPYRTWMLDAGPVAQAEFHAFLDRLNESIAASGLIDLALAPPQVECFEWIGAECA